MIQNQIGNNTTSSGPFVAGGVVYFRGTDNKLWRVNGDGTGQAQIGGNTTESTPFVTPDGWVWFQGTDNKLWKVFKDGSQQSQPGKNTTSSSPFVAGDWVYFRGTDNKLWRMKTDGSQQHVVNNNTTSSTPFVTPDGWVWFQGTDNKLWKVFNDGSHQSQPRNNTTSSSPTVMGDWVYFRGTDNKLWRMKTDGSQQNVINNNTTKSTPFVTPDGWVWFQGTDDKLWRLFQPLDPIGSGTMRPKYYVLSLLYSPPGANGGKSSSVVDYASGSTAGTTTSTSSSFKVGLNVTAGTSFNPLGLIKLGGSSEFTASSTTTDTTAENIAKSQTWDIKVPGPGADGINHDHDMFLLMLNPLIEASIYPGSNVVWNMGVDGQVMNIQSVYVGWLKDPGTMPAGVKQQLDAAGLNTADYAQILSANPFANGASTIDSSRFLPTPQSFPYEPPFSAADPVFTSSIATQNTVNVTDTHTVQHQYGVTASISGGIAITLKIASSLEWTNTNIMGTSTTSQQSATATVGGPAFGYRGPTDVVVYWDSIYNSFMFAFPADPPTASGTLLDSSGKPASYKPVTLTVGSHTFKTFTNDQGKYRFYGAPGGNGSLAVEGNKFPVVVGAGVPQQTLHLP